MVAPEVPAPAARVTHCRSLSGPPTARRRVEQASAIHAKELPTLRTYGDDGTLEAFSASYETTELGSLDDRFYALELSPHRIRYIRAHPDELTSP